jgi:hypothetical protein
VIAYSWNEGATDSLVRFELTPEGDGTHLMLRHTFEGESTSRATAVAGTTISSS